MWRRSNSKWSIAWRLSSNQCKEPTGCIVGKEAVQLKRLVHKWCVFPVCDYRQLCKILSSKTDAWYCINGPSRKGLPHAFDFDRCSRKKCLNNKEYGVGEEYGEIHMHKEKKNDMILIEGKKKKKKKTGRFEIKDYLKIEKSSDEV